MKDVDVLRARGSRGGERDEDEQEASGARHQLS
jgi:hypothetical protein